jgi:protein-L-isoaspartate(D-aspartate) O-methyltransferase
MIKMATGLFAVQKKALIDTLRSYGISDQRVLSAMETVPRHEFVPQSLLDEAYNNYPLPIGNNQTISQPLMVAEMAQVAEFKGTDKVLEVGSGCGYNAAIMSKLCHIVYSTEIIPQLSELAKTNINKVGYSNIVLVGGDGSIGLPDHAPYDVIMVTASAPQIPKQLKEQLSVNGGRLIVPVHNHNLGYDRLMKVKNLV